MRKCVILHFSVVASVMENDRILSVLDNSALLRGRLNFLNLGCELLPEAISIRLNFEYKAGRFKVNGE